MEFTKVEKWEDVARFAGRTVCYKTKSKYIEGDCNFKIDENQYGTISDSVHFWTPDPWGSSDFESGYQLHRICLEKSVVYKRALINTVLTNSELEIRLATESEKTILLDALKQKQCKIEYNDNIKSLK